MSLQENGSLNELQTILGYQFANIDLLKQALVHGSADKDCNQRLEFLGDSVLGLIIAAEIYQRYPELTEGAMSRLRASLVKGKQLAAIAKTLKLGTFIQLGFGEQKSGGAKRASTLADALEAVIAAIYLDSDLETASQAVLQWYTTLWDSAHSLLQKDPKSRLQEWLQSKRCALPVYRLCGTYGYAHEAVFEIECSIESYTHTIKTKDSTRRGAEQQAAEQFIQWLIEQGEEFK
jgi:ribonuclease-3